MLDNKKRELKENEVLEIKSDRLFHDLWNEKEMNTIEWTVMQILHCDYADIHGKVRVGNIRFPNQSKSDKQKFVDLVVYYKEMITVIELNNNASGNYLRNVLYTLVGINNCYIEGERYTGKRIRGILVNLNWFNESNLKRYPKAKEEIIYQYPVLGENGDYLLKVININLDYFSKICYDDIEKSDSLWKLLTIHDKDELKKIVAKEKLLTDYGNKLDRLSRDREYCDMIWDERIEKNLRAQQEYFDGKQDGFDEGIEQKQKEMIINLYKNGASLELIGKSSNLTIDEVKKIIEED